jgi:large subunit ribosomal protein L17
MHSHGYKGRKLHRDSSQRCALLRGLAISLIEHGAIKTTLPKAKEVLPFVETLITKSKKADLHNRRQILSNLGNLEATNRLVDVIAPQLTLRDSGHLRIVRNEMRVGDNAQMATISFVDNIDFDLQVNSRRDEKHEKSTQKTEKIDAKRSEKMKAEEVAA